MIEKCLDTIDKVIVLSNAADKGNDLGSVGEKINQMMPSLPIMFSTIGALIFLMIILHLLLYKPVSKMVKNRKNFIQKNIDDSLKAKDEAAELSNQAYLELSQARTMANEIINRAKKEAEITKVNYINNAKVEAKRLLTEANLDVENLKIKFEKSKKNQIIDAAVIISEKIIDEKINDDELDKYYSEFLKGKLNAN